MKDKIFISHSSKDIFYVQEFVDKVLKLGLEISADRIFCSSMEGHGVKLGEYIPDILREEVNKAGLAFLFISKNYKESEVCLNELGAAWVTLEKRQVILLLLPEMDFSELGFLDTNRLGINLNNETDLIRLIEDQKQILNSNFKLPLLTRHLKEFLANIPIYIKNVNPKISERSEYEKCFRISLYPFGEISQKALPNYNDGIHYISDVKQIQRVLKELVSKDFEHNLWYCYGLGDMHVENCEMLNSGNLLLNFWEIEVSELWVSISTSLQNEFILIKSKAMNPYTINSDIGGQSHTVGVLSDGTIVSEQERGNGYAIIDDEVININDLEVKPRYNRKGDNWVFLSTCYHKIGNNLDESEEFCKKLDLGIIELNEESLLAFLHSLMNHPTVIQYM